MEYAGGSDPAFPGLDQVNIVNETLGGASVTGTVALNGVARAGGFPVSLRSSVPTVTAPSTVTVPQGQAAANFTISTPTTAASQSHHHRAGQQCDADRDARNRSHESSPTRLICRFADGR